MRLTRCVSRPSHSSPRRVGGLRGFGSEHPNPATESEFFAETLLDSMCGEDIFLAPVIMPEPICRLPVQLPSMPPSHLRLPSVPRYLLLSVAWLHLGSARNHPLRGTRSPKLRLQPRKSTSCLNPSSWLLRSFRPLPQSEPSAFLPRLTPSARQLHLGQTSLRIRCGLMDRPLLSGPPPLRLRLALPYLPQASSPASVAPTRPQTSGSPPRSREVVAAAPSRPPESSPSLHHLGSSAARWVPSSPSLYTVIPMAALISALPWLLPPSTLPWGTTLAVAWMNIQQSLLKAINWLSPPSAPPWTPGFRLLPVGHPPPEPPPASARFIVTSSTSRTPSGPPL
ncbi:hypothetical protein DPX16_5259 [Anabarilius grahami]|uniref:Uncharacterized protein n=1 Tax=Anabarilius grahami TaxID=495550 RepID=A0A3N0Y1D9_ANAGA|nr:hypothetical protein DPX16_5259 [Anabarilius grahami]